MLWNGQSPREAMTRIPVIATIVVALAVATMIALGVWQLRRAEWKDGLIERYAVAATLPPVAIPSPPDRDSAPLFRRASAICLDVVGWRAVAGRSAKGASGWSHIARCRTGAEGPGLSVDVGWSRESGNPSWKGGAVDGVITTDPDHVIRLVASRPVAGLQTSAPPDIAAIPNNHRGYAFQWFAFAGVATAIYAVALRHRSAAASTSP